MTSSSSSSFLITSVVLLLAFVASNSGQLVYDVAVVGGGLFGSAVAKYAAEDGVSVVMVGPSEEAKLTAEIFGAWHDEGRIAELADSDGVWHVMANHSIARFRSIEKKSGVNFFNENGFMNVLSKAISDPDEVESYDDLCDSINSDGHTCLKLNDTVISEQFPYLSMPQDFVANYQPDFSGVINPRQLVKAQLTIAKKLGCDIIDGHVTSVVRLTDTVFAISANRTDGSGENFLFAKTVVVASGAYVNLNNWLENLLPKHLKSLKPDLVLARETATFLQVSEAEAARLKNMPNFVTHYQYGPLDGTYILPPITYPDGKIYLKLGHLDAFETTIPDDTAAEEIIEWYQGSGYPEAVEVLSDFIQKHFMPDVQVLDVKGVSCVIAKTPAMANPYIGYMADGLILVGGGNGFGANGSDEIGRIGARLATRNTWTSEVPPDTLAVKWKPRKPKQQK